MHLFRGTKSSYSHLKGTLPKKCTSLILVIIPILNPRLKDIGHWQLCQRDSDGSVILFWLYFIVSVNVNFFIELFIFFIWLGERHIETRLSEITVMNIATCFCKTTIDPCGRRGGNIAGGNKWVSLAEGPTWLRVTYDKTLLGFKPQIKSLLSSYPHGQPETMQNIYYCFYY